MTGKPITDSRNGVVKPRIDTLATVQLAPPSFSISSSTPVDIPDGTGSATATTTVSGFTRPIAAVQIWVEINHPEPEQLRLTLLGPDGTSALLQNQTGKSQHPINAIYGKTDVTVQSLDVFAGKQADGVWTLKVEDLVTGATGRIRDFSMMIIPPTESLGYFTLPPCRVIDTRDPSGPLGGPALAGGSTRTFPIASQCGIPADAASVSANITITGPTAEGHLTFYPNGTAPPLVSMINYRAGQTRANNAILVLGPSEDFNVSCAGVGTVNLILDVNGYFR
jgi:subtilisin-like proprotein convertase family protein